MTAGPIRPGIWYRKRENFGKRSKNWGDFPREPNQGFLRGFLMMGRVRKEESGLISGVFSSGVCTHPVYQVYDGIRKSRMSGPWYFGLNLGGFPGYPVPIRSIIR